MITSYLFQIVGIVFEIWGLYYLTIMIILQRLVFIKILLLRRGKYALLWCLPTNNFSPLKLFCWKSKATTCKFSVLHDIEKCGFWKSQKSWILLKVKGIFMKGLRYVKDSITNVVSNDSSFRCNWYKTKEDVYLGTGHF